MARSDAGGIARAAALLVEYGGAIEADLQRFYGIHVGDFPWPLTARRLHVLLEHLPNDAAFHGQLIDADDRPWTFEASLLATIIDELRFSQYHAARLAGVKSAKVPDPIPRPGTRPAPKPARPVSPEARAAALEARGITIPDDLKGGA